MAGLSESIATNAANPQSVTQDGTTVQMPSLQDQIAADRYLAGKAAGARQRRGLRFMRIMPAGTVS